MHTIPYASFRGKTVLVQMALDVPMQDGAITDDSRLRASLPLVQRLLQHECRVVLAGHVGRPEGRPDPSLSTAPVAQRLSQLLGQTVTHIPHVVGPEAQEALRQVPSGSVAVLENLRFHPGEEERSEEFAQGLAALADGYINDDYPDAHRATACNVLLPRLLPSHMGPTLQSEYETVLRAVDAPEKPFVLIIGGAKADKIGAINNLLGVADTIIVGGVLANTFLAASGLGVGASKVDDRSMEIAGEFLRDAEEKFLLPTDVVVAKEFSERSEHKELPLEDVPDGWMILDIGAQTAERYAEAIRGAGTVVWGGPIGVYEWEPFRRGTEAVAQALAASEAYTLVAGGDSGDAVRSMGLAERMDHVSIGGGATLKLIAGEPLPAVQALQKD